MLKPANVFFLLTNKEEFLQPYFGATGRTAPNAFASKAAAILLSGANADGVESLCITLEKGEIAAVQDYKTAEVLYLPQQAFERLSLLTVLSIEDIPLFIDNFLK